MDDSDDHGPGRVDAYCQLGDGTMILSGIYQISLSEGTWSVILFPTL